MKIPAEVKYKMNVIGPITKLQRLGELSNKAVDAVNAFNEALEKCEKMDLGISIIYKTSTKKWWQFWKVKIGKSRANALREYTSNPMAKAVVSPSAFMEFFLGLTTEQIELIKAIRDKEMKEKVSKIKQE